MNIHDAIIKGQKENKAIRRKLWSKNVCVYHKTNNMFYWFCKDNQSGIQSGIQNGSEFTYCVAHLKADDWEVTDLLSYHGNDYINEINEEEIPEHISLELKWEFRPYPMVHVNLYETDMEHRIKQFERATKGTRCYYKGKEFRLCSFGNHVVYEKADIVTNSSYTEKHGKLQYAYFHKVPKEKNP